MSVFSIIFAIIKAIPVVQNWIESFLVFYAEQKKTSMKRENREAILKAISEGDTRDLDKAVGAPNPGEVIDAPGSEIISGPPPGVNS